MPVTHTSAPRTGLFLCECGPNMGHAIQLDELARDGAFPDATVVERHAMWCTPEGKARLAQRVRDLALDRVVVGGCSPHEHEATFRQVLVDAGLNPFLLQVANLREQCEWQGADGTQRATQLLQGALARVSTLTPVTTESVQASVDVLVVGGGMAGISAALALAQKERRVTVVEQGAALGGLLVRLDEVFPSMKCASCFLQPAINQLLDHPGVDVRTSSRVVSVRGVHGQFTVEVESQAQVVDPALCLGAGACTQACPVTFSDEGEEGLVQRKAIGHAYSGALPAVSFVDPVRCTRLNGQGCDAPCVTACPMGAVDFSRQVRRQTITCGAVVLATGMETRKAPAVDGVYSCVQAERLLHPHGPTQGRVVLPDGSTPRRVVLAPCGPMTARETDLARQELVKVATRLLDVLPGVALHVAGDCQHSTTAAGMVKRLLDAGCRLTSGHVDVTALKRTAQGVAFTLAGAPSSADMVVLWTGVGLSAAVQDLVRDLHVEPGVDGFVEGDQDVWAPTATNVPGIYAVGTVLGPRLLGDVVRDGTAAAGRILSTLHTGEELTLEPLAARVDESRCGKCGVCVGSCPYGAIRTLADGTCRVVTSQCRGCGTCAAACPSLAIISPQYEHHQLSAEISGLLALPAGTPAT
jgi:heterodisulfide reductase subunit A